MSILSHTPVRVRDRRSDGLAIRLHIGAYGCDDCGHLPGCGCDCCPYPMPAVAELQNGGA